MPVFPKAFLRKRLLSESDLEMVATRDGFGRGLLAAGKKDDRIIALSADVASSTRAHWFEEEYPERFFEVGVAEQNLATVASGFAAEGFIPFISAFAAFSPGRNWEQIRTTICYNNVPVKVVGSHTGLSVGADGATHQALEDIGLMRMLPNMDVVVPADAIEAEAATIALAQTDKPAYLRVARMKTPVFTTKRSPFVLGKASTLMTGRDITIIACGTMVYEAVQAAETLRKEQKIRATVINMHTIKPLDADAIIAAAEKTGAIVVAEEHQRAGGLGSAVAELLSQVRPTPLSIVGVDDRYGESGSERELWEAYGLGRNAIVTASQQLLRAFK